jgi:anti-sigma-K factor RskA
MTHEQLIESAAAYALGTLDGDDRAAFEAHLPDCEECQTEVEAFREVTGLLAHGTPAVRPANSGALRDRILRDARDVRPLSSAPSKAVRPAKGASIMPWLAAAACLTIAAVSGLSYSRERAQLALAEHDLAATRADLAGRDSTIAAFLGPEVHVVSLSEPKGKPSARVFWNHTRNVFIVTAFNLPPVPAGKTYQLWAIRNGKPPLSMGTFALNASGRATAIVPVPQNITDGGFIDDCALTVEPAGGSAQPTETPRLMGAWRHVD